MSRYVTIRVPEGRRGVIVEPRNGDDEVDVTTRTTTGHLSKDLENPRAGEPENDPFGSRGWTEDRNTLSARRDPLRTFRVQRGTPVGEESSGVGSGTPHDYVSRLSSETRRGEGSRRLPTPSPSPTCRPRSQFGLAETHGTTNPVREVDDSGVKGADSYPPHPVKDRPVDIVSNSTKTSLDGPKFWAKEEGGRHPRPDRGTQGVRSRGSIPLHW